MLVVVVASVMALLLFSGGPGGVASLAQGTSPSPTPTSGASGPFRIEFLNPSGNGHSEELSDKPDGTDSAYHLVAWVNQVPSDVRVEFKYRIPGQNEDKIIGVANQVNPGDTFEFDWDIPDEIPEGQDTFTLLAILYSGGTEVDRDSESDLYKNSMSPPNQTHRDDDDEIGSTVEITYPGNGGAFGLYTPRDQQTQSVIDVQRSEIATDATDAEVVVHYTVSAPGTEPSWVECGSDGGGGIDDGIRCSLSHSHTLDQVTAVASTAFDLTCEPVFGICGADDDSGDAHRVVPYQQLPTSITIIPDRQNDLPLINCSALFVVTVTDQNQRQIAGAPIDVHARGPSDNLTFDDNDSSGNNSSASDPAESPHTREATTNCESGADPPPANQNSLQGEHNDPAGPDLKHIESTLTGGTNDVGIWRQQLLSGDPGGTQVTFWVDDDADDQHCSAEISVSASLGWAGSSPDVTGIPPEVSDCPRPSPSPQVSRTPSPTPTTSPTEDPRGCTIVGTDADETLTGTDGDDVICGYGGNDLIRGAGGNDTIYGDDGADEIRGGSGNDFADGGAGKDTIRLAGGNDFADGGRHNDVVTGGIGNDEIDGSSGFDTLRGGGGADELSGGRGRDILRGGKGPDTLRGGRGSDVLHGDRGRDRCRGGPGKDRLRSC